MLPTCVSLNTLVHDNRMSVMEVFSITEPCFLPRVLPTNYLFRNASCILQVNAIQGLVPWTDFDVSVLVLITDTQSVTF